MWFSQNLINSKNNADFRCLRTLKQVQQTQRDYNVNYVSEAYIQTLIALLPAFIQQRSWGNEALNQSLPVLLRQRQQIRLGPICSFHWAAACNQISFPHMASIAKTGSFEATTLWEKWSTSSSILYYPLSLGYQILPQPKFFLRHGKKLFCA